jgi:hypothetical protein
MGKTEQESGSLLKLYSVEGNTYTVWHRNLKDSDRLAEPCVDGRIISSVGVYTGRIWYRMGTSEEML